MRVPMISSSVNHAIKKILHFMRGILVILQTCLFLICSIISYGQGALSAELDQYFEKYHLGSPDKTELKSSSSMISWSIGIGSLSTREAILFENDLVSENYTISTPAESLSPHESLPKTYSGYLLDDPESSIRMSIAHDKYFGYIQTGESKYYIEPADNFTKTKSAIHVLYQEKDVKNKENSTCAASQTQRRKSNMQIKESPSLKSSGCRTYELAIALDNSYVQNHNGTNGAIAQSTAVMNMVAGDYEQAFSEEIRFEIVEHWVSTCSNCDPWTSSADAGQLLDSFTEWGPAGFNSIHDIGQLWTGKDIFFRDTNGNPFFSTVGLAWIDVVCRSFRYHILEDFSSSLSQLRVLTSHEIGHNFNGDHDANGTSFIMSPSITNTTTWSASSQAAINNAITSHNCFSSCTSSDCDPIVTLSNPVTDQTITAGQLITTSGAVQISNNVTLSAPNIQLGNLSIVQGATFTLSAEGCN